MAKLPDYIGPAALGIKMGVIVPACDLLGMVTTAIEKCNDDNLLDNGDVVCITESILARAQGNYVTLENVSQQIRDKLGVSEKGRIGVVFPIASRNRFSLILEGIAAAVPQGEIVLQLSYPRDEVGNDIISSDYVESLGKENCDIIKMDELGDNEFLHPITKVNYLKLYKDCIEDQGTKATIVLCNDASQITSFNPDGIIAADIHTRTKTQAKIKEQGHNCITLTDICSQGEKWSEWGLLGSNMSSGKKLKLAPRESEEFAEQVKEKVYRNTGKDIEVIIYGDGAYKDPTTGIYELADPMPVFGATKGIYGKFREGVKYKFLADLALDEGKTPQEIESFLKEKKEKALTQNEIENEGTTPRKKEDVIASLADLVSGSADAGTPVILVKGF